MMPDAFAEGYRSEEPGVHYGNQELQLIPLRMHTDN